MAIDVPHLLARKLHSALQDSRMKRVKFGYPGTLQKICYLCRTSVGSNSMRRYIRKPEEQQKNEGLPQPSLKNNVEGVSTITTSTVHGQPFEDSMEFVGNKMPWLFPEEDVGVTTFVVMHGNVNAYQWEEFMNNDMDRSLTSDEDLSHAKYSFDGRFVFSLFYKNDAFQRTIYLLGGFLHT